MVSTGSFTVDLAAKKVHRDGAQVHLTRTEWAVLELLVRHRGRLVSQKQLLTEVWGPAHENESHYLRVYLAQLRRKPEPEPAHPRHLRTDPGMGSRFEPLPPSPVPPSAVWIQTAAKVASIAAVCIQTAERRERMGGWRGCG